MMSGVLLPLTCVQPFSWTPYHEHPPSSHQSVIALSFSPCLHFSQFSALSFPLKAKSVSTRRNRVTHLLSNLATDKNPFYGGDGGIPPTPTPPKKAFKSLRAASKCQKLGLHWTWMQGPRETVRSIWLARGFI